MSEQSPPVCLATSIQEGYPIGATGMCPVRVLRKDESGIGRCGRILRLVVEDDGTRIAQPNINSPQCAESAGIAVVIKNQAFPPESTYL